MREFPFGQLELKRKEKPNVPVKFTHCPHLGFIDPQMNPGSPPNQASPAG